MSRAPGPPLLLLGGLCGGLLGCAPLPHPLEPERPAPSASPAVSAASPSPVEPAPPSPPSPRPQLSGRSAPTEGAVELKFPVAEQRISASRVNKYLVRYELRSAPPDARLVGWLDEHPAVALPSGAAQVPLLSLVPPGVSLADGAHRLVLALLGPDERLLTRRGVSGRAPFATVHFWVGARDAPAPRAPELLLVRPASPRVVEGTLPIDFVVAWQHQLPPDQGLTLRIVAAESGEERWTLRHPIVEPVVLQGLPSGAWRLELSLDARPSARVSWEVTVVPREGAAEPAAP